MKVIIRVPHVPTKVDELSKEELINRLRRCRASWAAFMHYMRNDVTMKWSDFKYVNDLFDGLKANWSDLEDI